MRYRYYITDTINGKVLGCDDDITATDYAMCEDYFVIDTASGDWLTEDGPKMIEGCE